MKPHLPHPLPRKIEVDISGILIRPEDLKLPEPSSDLGAGTIVLAQSDRSSEPRRGRIGPPGWANINFVAVSALIAFFCTIFIRDSFEYSRRSAHLPADVSDLRPEFNLAKSQDFSLEPSRLAAALPLDHFQSGSLAEQEVSLSQSPALSPLPQFRPDQTFASSANNNSGLANTSSATNNSRSVSSESTGPSRLSRTTSASAENPSGGETSSRHSSIRTVTRRWRKSMTSSRTTISSHRQSIQRSLTNSVRNQPVSRATRQNGGGLGASAHDGQSRVAKTQIANTPGLMSMHSLGNGGALRQLHGPMHMESGMLAQPGIGAGLGGVSGNGLGGGGGIRGGNRPAK